MKATRKSAILRSGIREIITSNEPRTRMIFSVHGKNQAHRLSSIQEAVGLVSDSFQLLRGNEILPEAKLPVYQKSGSVLVYRYTGEFLLFSYPYMEL